jgi:hypothetical protein
MQYRAMFTAVAALVAMSAAAYGQDEPDAPAAAPASPPPPVLRVAPGYVPDAVHLKNGGLLRGVVIESAPGDHVKIALPNGETRQIAWGDVDHVTIGGAGGAPMLPPAPPPAKVGPTARVHIAADPSVLLDRRPAGSDTWVPACSAPCEEELPLGDEYRLSGPGLRSTDVFTLQGTAGGRVDIAVNPSTKLAWWVGAGIGGMGLVIDAYAAYIIALGAALHGAACGPYQTTGDCQSSRDTGGTVRNVGLVMLIPGTAAAVIGGAMMWSNWRTKVVQGGTEGLPAAAPPRLDAFVRTPENAGATRAWAPEAPSMFVPLASGRF